MNLPGLSMERPVSRLPRTPGSRARQRGVACGARGFAMIEVLVTTVVLAFGLLGLAGLLVKSTSMTQESYQRTIVTQRIYDFADRMRLNQAGITAGDYNNLSAQNMSTQSSSNCNSTSAQTPAQIAQCDFYEWTQSLQTELAGSVTSSSTGTSATAPDIETGVVANTQQNPTFFTITVNWTDPKLGTQTYSLNVRP